MTLFPLFLRFSLVFRSLPFFGSLCGLFSPCETNGADDNLRPRLPQLQRSPVGLFNVLSWGVLRATSHTSHIHWSFSRNSQKVSSRMHFLPDGDRREWIQPDVCDCPRQRILRHLLSQVVHLLGPRTSRLLRLPHLFIYFVPATNQRRHP